MSSNHDIVSCTNCGEYYQAVREFYKCGKCRISNRVSSITTIKPISTKWNCYFCEKFVLNGNVKLYDNKICCQPCWTNYIKIQTNSYKDDEIDNNFILQATYQVSCIACIYHKINQAEQQKNRQKLIHEYGVATSIYDDTVNMHHETRIFTYSIPKNFEITDKTKRMLEIGNNIKACGCATIFTIRTARKKAIIH